MGGAGSEEKAVVENREWYLAAYAPEGVPTSDHLKLRTVPLSLTVDSIPDRHLVVQNLLISVDPYQRTRLTGLEDGLYFPQFKLNEVLETNFTLTPLQIYKYNALGIFYFLFFYYKSFYKLML
jgi:NADPH-dependent curcumin reductase CurA